MIVIESANIELITSLFVTHDPFIFIGMIQSLNCCVTFITFETSWAFVPSYSICQSLTVFWRIFEQFRRSSKVSCMMSKVAALWVVRVFFCWTPTCFVVEHEENIPLFFVIKINKVFFKETKCQQTIWNKIIFDTFILEVFVDSLYVCQVFDRERQ